MKYIVYITTNLQNNKIYIGVHKTEIDKFDGYIGCGINIFNPSTLKNPKTRFQYAVKKYGFDSFKRYTLAEFDTEEGALNLESILVNKKFINRNDVYNMIDGGGIINKHEIPLYQFDLSGKLLNSFNSIKEAAEKSNIHELNLISAYKFKKSCNNFYWSDKSEINIYEFKLVTQEKEIYCFDLSGNLIKSYKNLGEASIDFDVSRESIKNSINKMTLVNKHYFSYNSTFTLKLDINKIIYRYKIDGNYIDSDSILNYCNKFTLDSKKLFKASNSGLILNKYQWNIENPIKMQDLTSRQGIGKPKKIGRYNKNNELLETFDTVTECRKTYTNVRKVLNGQLSETKGFIFKYIQ